MSYIISYVWRTITSFLQENEISRTLDFIVSIVSYQNVDKEPNAIIFDNDTQSNEVTVNKQNDSQDKVDNETNDNSFDNDVPLKLAIDSQNVASIDTNIDKEACVDNDVPNFSFSVIEKENDANIKSKDND